jgi:hypothetical protein
MTLAGTPPMMVWSGMSLVTTELASMMQRFPMLTLAITATLYPRRVFDPIWTGAGMSPQSHRYGASPAIVNPAETSARSADRISRVTQFIRHDAA